MMGHCWYEADACSLLAKCRSPSTRDVSISYNVAAGFTKGAKTPHDI
jgi:hypothetical protein